MMQFACTARSADDEDYRPLAETPLTLDFAYDHGVSTLADPAVWQVTLTNNADAPWRGVVKLEHCVACDAPIRVDNRYPRLRAGTPEFPTSPWWMVRADRLSHPAAFLLDGGRWYGLSAAPYFVRQNGVLQPWQPGRAGTFAQFAGFTCSLNTGSVGYTLGYENAPWLFVQSHNIKPRAPMGENCLTLAAGESVAFPLYLYDFVAVDGERTLYAALEAVYGLWHTPPRPGTTPSHAAELLAGAVTRDAWLPDDKNYAGNSYPFGQCTWGAYNRLAQIGMPIEWFTGDSGNGGDWGESAKAKGYKVEKGKPHIGWAASFHGGLAGSDPTAGHIAVVEYVNPDGSILVSETNVVKAGSGLRSWRVISKETVAQVNFIQGRK